MPKDSWNRDYESLVELGAQIGIKIRERDADRSNSKLNGSIKKMLQEYQRKLQSLGTILHQQSRNYSSSEYEISKRQGEIEELSSKYEQLQKAYNKGWSTETRYNSTGLDPWDERGGASHGPGSAHRMSADEIRTQQQVIIDEQDQGLDELSKALRQQRNLGLAIQDEVGEQNTLIDEIHAATTKTEDKIRFQTRRVEVVRRKDSCKCTCALWTIIVLLAIAIVVVAAVPFK